MLDWAAPTSKNGDDLAESPQIWTKLFGGQRGPIPTHADCGTARRDSNIQGVARPDVAEFHRRDSSGNIDAIFDQILKDAPDVKQAEAKIGEAQANLHQAELNLAYCDVVAEIDGVVTRRNVNPGDRLSPVKG